MGEIPDRYCDIVMKGGVTSGVVYPSAVAELSKSFRFRSIGGTSAGAIAAAAAAAAELGRSTGRNPAAFEEVGRLGGVLQEMDETGSYSRLFSFFQPQKGTSKVYRTLVAALPKPESAAKGKGAGDVPPKPSGLQRAVPLLKEASLSYPFVFLGGSLPGVLVTALALHAEHGPLRLSVLVIGVLLAIAGCLLAPLVALAREGFRELPKNMYGLCSGAEGDKKLPFCQREPLTYWLHGYLNGLAGISPDQPLTFGDLKKAAPEVDLQMFTTCLTWGRPYRLPFGDDEKTKENRFYYRPDEFAKLFPPVVLDWLGKHPRKSTLDPRWIEAGYRPFPEMANLPVVVATRMSLSFPILLSALPLYAYDMRLNGQPRLDEAPRRCWFSDGGLCANFPVHLFDSPLPRWPTFSIDLVDVPEGTPKEDLERPFMAQDNNDGIQERWSGWTGEKGGFPGILGFLSTIIGTMQGWSDNSLARMPGYRDRVAGIGLRPQEGGLNLNMDPAVIGELAKRGTATGQAFTERFSPGSTHEMNWTNHRWTRMRCLLDSLGDMITGLHGSYDHPEVPDPSYAELLGKEPGELVRSYKLTERDRARAVELMEELLDLAGKYDTKPPEFPFMHGTPHPRPQLRPRPRI